MYQNNTKLKKKIKKFEEAKLAKISQDHKCMREENLSFDNKR
jgi:hypothetical protein